MELAEVLAVALEAPRDRGPVAMQVTSALALGDLRDEEQDDGTVKSAAYFAMYVADRGGPSQLHVCGEYDDVLVVTADGIRFAEHRVIIDAETVPANMGVLL